MYMYIYIYIIACRLRPVLKSSSWKNGPSPRGHGAQSSCVIVVMLLWVVYDMFVVSCVSSCGCSFMSVIFCLGRSPPESSPRPWTRCSSRSSCTWAAQNQFKPF